MDNEEIASEITGEFETILNGNNEDYIMNGEVNMDLLYEYVLKQVKKLEKQT